jgi:hypothetical protein
VRERATDNVNSSMCPSKGPKAKFGHTSNAGVVRGALIQGSGYPQTNSASAGPVLRGRTRPCCIRHAGLPACTAAATSAAAALVLAPNRPSGRLAVAGWQARRPIRIPCASQRPPPPSAGQEAASQGLLGTALPLGCVSVIAPCPAIRAGRERPSQHFGGNGARARPSRDAERQAEDGGARPRTLSRVVRRPRRVDRRNGAPPARSAGQ